MNINDIILVTDYKPGGEQVNYLMTMEDVLQKYLYTSSFSTQEFVSTILWLNDTAGSSADRADWCTINLSPEHTVLAKYCTDAEQMRGFLHDARRVGRFDAQNSNQACLDSLATVGITASGAPFPLSGYSYQKIATDFEAGQEVRNFNGRTYRIMEKLSSENYLLMDKDSGTFMVACGMKSYARYPKGMQGNGNMIAYGVEWAHGVYLNSSIPSEIDFANIKREYGCPENYIAHAVKTEERESAPTQKEMSMEKKTAVPIIKQRSPKR